MVKLCSLESALTDAVALCAPPDLKEECGGVVMHKASDIPTEDEYVFYMLKNIDAGTAQAETLWTADRHQYAKTIIPLFKKGWRQFASFHTHPQFLNWPSEIDINVLFPGFKWNYIFSGVTRQLARYSYSNDKKLMRDVILLPCTN